MSETRIGIIGAGYIATWHADALRATPGVALTAVCDVSETAARGFAEGYGLAAYSSVEALIEAKAVDAVHITTPPHLHAPLAEQCLEAGLHCLVEKPVAESSAQMRAMAEQAAAKGLVLAAGHNFLGLPSYDRLKALVTRGQLGKIATAEVHWHLPLAPLRSGPYGLWLLREPRNLLLELGPHLVAFAHDLFGPVEVISAEASHPVALPGMGTRPQVMRIMARAGDVDVSFVLSTVEVIDDRSVVVRGSTGLARLDYANDVLVTRFDNTADIVANPLLSQLAQGAGHWREGMRNLGTQLTSLNKENPYGLSFRGTFRCVYDAIANGSPLDARFAPDAAVSVMETLEHALDAMDLPNPPALPAKVRDPKPKAVVIGGTGFIGRHLTRGLVAQGQDVRVLSRGRHGPFADLPNEVETMGVSLHDRDGLARAFEGVEVVYNLAKSLDDTWEDALRNDVGVAVNVAEACLAAGASRLVYTGTIASYDMSNPAGVITEDTSFGEDLSTRNLYARSKAECERRLMAMHRERNLPVTIARPGIVIGPGGPLQHWGIGRWHGAGAVKLWGGGDNVLPFVLIEDVVDGLIAMGAHHDAVGESFNLVGDPMMTARQYFNAIHREMGAELRVRSGNLHALWLMDAIKYPLKRYGLGRKQAVRASLKDWKSRAHLTPFDNAKPKRVLGWQPESSKAAVVRRGIVEAGLFGL
ncbi:NAD-dependent epimerase/dehydratase family protein [Primorskyibacter sp. S187A]|uniref:NAD-dependent epimerase/dehydratase family protein n=1 Tax=Primorskyibacter sp. S187A TaxID=3415130 RepID=UPI003C7D426E